MGVDVAQKLYFLASPTPTDYQECSEMNDLSTQKCAVLIYVEGMGLYSSLFTEHPSQKIQIPWHCVHVNKSILIESL